MKYTLGGADAAKYITPADKVVTTGEITVAPLTVSAPSLTDTKVYDGNNTAVVTAGTLSGVAPTENVTVSATATYDNADAGTDKTMTVVYTLGGTDAAKYTAPVNQVIETGVITAAPLAINHAATVDSKVYDGTDAATVSAEPTFTGVIGTDDVTVNSTGAFVDANVANSKTVNLTYILGGANAGNYSLASTTVTADITAKQLTIADPTAIKVYDGNTDANLTVGDLVGLEGSDVVTVSATGTYDSADVGTNKAVDSITYTLGGAQAGNYIAPVTSSISTGEITAAPLTAIGNITGTVQQGEVLTAGVVTPTGATVTYEWQIANSADGLFSAIPSATNSTYTAVVGDVGKFIRVVVTGSGNYSGTATSDVTTAVIAS